MSIVIHAHFDGKTIVLDEPVDLPINEPLEFELKQTPVQPAWDSRKAMEAVDRIASRAINAGIPREALRREHMYEPVEAEFRIPEPKLSAEEIKRRLAALRRLEATAVKGVDIPLEALRREHTYEPDSGL